MTGSIRIFEKLNFTPKLSALAFLKVKLPNMTDWHRKTLITFYGVNQNFQNREKDRTTKQRTND